MVNEFRCYFILMKNHRGNAFEGRALILAMGFSLLSAGCGDDTNPAVDACQDVADAYCTRVFDCCEADSACDPATDLTALGATAAECSATTGDAACPAIETLSENTNVGFDQAALDACAQDIDSATCMDLAGAADDLVALCSSPVFNPTQDAGDPCEVPQECITNSCGTDGLCAMAP